MGAQKMFQVIIANPVVEEQQRIRKAMEASGRFRVIYMTHDGLDCMREVVSKQPDLLILDMVLEKVDGLEVLRRLKEFSLPGTKLFVTSNYGGYLAEQALLAGADYCLLTPYSHEVLVERVLQLLVPPKSIRTDREIDQASVHVLRQLGAPNHLSGYGYVLEGVRIVIRDPDVIRRRRTTRDIYQVLADAHGVPLIRVERVMRTLTTHVVDQNPTEILLRYFKSSAIQNGRIPNTVFLSVVSDLVRERLSAPTPELRAKTFFA